MQEQRAKMIQDNGVVENTGHLLYRLPSPLLHRKAMSKKHVSFRRNTEIYQSNKESQQRYTHNMSGSLKLQNVTRPTACPHQKMRGIMHENKLLEN